MDGTENIPVWVKELGFNSFDEVRERKLELEQIIYGGGSPELREANAKEHKIRNTIKEEFSGEWPEIRDKEDTINFLRGETYGGDMGEEAFEFAKEEVEVLEAEIRAAIEKHSDKPIWKEWIAARLEVENCLKAEAEKDEKAKAEHSRIESYQVRKSGIASLLPEKKEAGKLTLEDHFEMNEYNERIRRLEYHTRLYPDHVKLGMTLEEAIEIDWDYDHSAWYQEPVDELRMEVDALTTQSKWNKIEYNRLERKLDGANLDNQHLHRINAQKAPKRGGGNWHVNTLSNIELLQKLELPGESIEVLFNKRDDHVQRDLCVRYGVNVGDATRVRFNVKYYSHMNNYYGYLEGYKDSLVLIGLFIDRMNKVIPQSTDLLEIGFKAATVLRPMDQGRKYLELERKYLPGGVGLSKYSRGDLLLAHNKIMTELYEE